MAESSPPTMPPSVSAVVGTAQAMGIDPYLALATADVESGLNPTAVGDNGTSYGLFQLHQGGELGNLTPAQADNPYVNAQVAEAQMAAVAQANPGADPGAIAALAQRPADPAAYAAQVDQVYGQLAQAGPVPAAFPTTGAVTVSSSSASSSNSWWDSLWNRIQGLGKVSIGLGSGNLGEALQGAGQAATGESAAQVRTDWWHLALKLVFVLAGLGMIVLGLARLFPGVTRTVTQAVRA